ncbi:MAG: hypothetical protein EXX96DRAFT_615869 [Benjaminiella poitrasii]|nr:MAG: hypothetical protein EXX96DRAFT_615869 [Benjaminiella poitrasii]
MSKDMTGATKVGGMLYTEPSSFNMNTTTPTTRANLNKSTSFSQAPQDFEHWRSNSLPTSTTPLPPSTNNNNNNPAINPISCDLQEVIVYYQSQPELLRLILMSKVEEDKRRAEEAKLRAKELDMLLIQQQQQQLAGTTTPQTPDIMSANNNNNNTHSLLSAANQFANSATPRRPSALEMLMDDSDCNRRDSALGSSFDGSANSDELDDRNNFSPNSSSMLSMSFPQPMMSVSTTPNTTSTRHSSLHPLSPPYNNALDDNNTNRTSPFSPQIKIENDQQCRYYNDTMTAAMNASYFPTTTTTSTTTSTTTTPTTTTSSSSQQQQRPRRRREMQAISKIVETRDYPYVDGYFWKNNGNTIQKKTGNKSVYYKCSNSSKGCPVNKTVTWKENGEYLIKYRGEHLPECGKVQRIVDM